MLITTQDERLYLNHDFHAILDQLTRPSDPLSFPCLKAFMTKNRFRNVHNHLSFNNRAYTRCPSLPSALSRYDSRSLSTYMVLLSLPASHTQRHPPLAHGSLSLVTSRLIFVSRFLNSTGIAFSFMALYVQRRIVLVARKGLHDSIAFYFGANNGE